MLTKLKEQLDEFKAAELKFQKEFRASLQDSLQEVFDSCPKLKLITWAQYTPSFNDGDPCYFSTTGPVFSNYESANYGGDWEGEEDEPEDFETYSGWDGKEQNVFTKEEWANFKILIDILNGAEEYLESIFGEHAEVRITRDSNGKAIITVEDYDCGF